MDIEAELDERSFKIAQCLFQVHPDWQKYAKIQPLEGEPNQLCIRLPKPPSSNLSDSLWILIDCGEVIVGLDDGHAHFSTLHSPSEQELESEDVMESDNALRFIEALLSEEVAVVFWYQNEEWWGSSFIVTASDLDSSFTSSPFNKIRVRSWQGTFDRDIDV